MADKRTLTIALEAEVSSLKKGMADARNQMGMLQKSSQTTANIMKAAFTGLAGIAAFSVISNGVRSMVSSFEETAALIEDTKHLADAIGATTQEIQVLQRTAELAEVDMSMLGRSVKIFTKNLGAASMGDGAMGEALAKLGLDAQTLIQMSLPERLAAIGSAMAGLGSNAQQASIAASLFGKSGVDMLPFLLEGADALQQVQGEMMATGELFSNEQAAAVDEMGDSVTMAMGVWNALKNQLVIQVAPAIQYLADLMRDWASSSEGAVNGFVSSGLAYLVDGIASTINAVTKLQAVWYGLKAAVLLIATSLTWVWKAFGSAFNLVMTGVQEAFFRVLQLIGAGIDKLTAGVANLAGMVPGMGSMEGTDFSGSMQGYVDDAQKAREQAYANLGAGNDPFLQSLAKDSADALQKATELWASKSDLGDKFKEKAMEILSTPLEDSGMRKFYDESLDILDPIEKEKALREDINGLMSDQVDMANELKDAGEGRAFRTGEFSPFVGSVSGGMGGRDNLGVTGAAQTASAGNRGTNAPEANGLLQGILEATRATAINTARQPVAVLG